MKTLYKKIYLIICLIYCEIITNLENLFLRNFKSKSKSKLELEGFLKISKNSKLDISNKKFDFILDNNERSFYSNKYQKKIILNKENLREVIKMIFNKQFCNFLTLQTGFKYSIDFFGAYQNFSISEEEKDQPWYANHYHLDKPNSKNMLKVFIPMSEIEMNNGPLELINIKQTKRYNLKKINIEDERKIYLVGGLGDVFLCKLNVCLHKARIPDESYSTDLIMIQLNPSRRWQLNSGLYKRQFKTEPKFTTLSNKFVRRIKL